MSFSWLEHIGSSIVHVFEKAAPEITALQAIATPFENIYAPGLSQVINSGLTAITNAEAVAAAAGKQTGSGSVKLALVINSLIPQIAPVLSSIGVKNPTNKDYTNFVNGLVLALNAFTITQTESPAVPTAPLAGAAVTN